MNRCELSVEVLALVPKKDNFVAAGAFGAWLERFRKSLRSDVGTDVPCGDCDGCCVSSYTILVRPEDKEAMQSIPENLLVNAPGFQAGHKMMGYLSNGKCPMLSAGKCSIYGQRPQTCRDYDCRVFAAAGINAGGADKVVINRRVQEWQFAYPTNADRLAHDAVRAAALFIQRNQASHPGRFPTAPSGIAVLAVKVYAVFLDPSIQASGALAIATAIFNASREFDLHEPG